MKEKFSEGWREIERKGRGARREGEEFSCCHEKST